MARRPSNPYKPPFLLVAAPWVFALISLISLGGALFGSNKLENLLLAIFVALSFGALAGIAWVMNAAIRKGPATPIVRGWCPFVVGEKYRVLEYFESTHDRFHPGDVLIFEGNGYSIYDSGNTFKFSHPVSGKELHWDVDDQEHRDNWRALFKKVEN